MRGSEAIRIILRGNKRSDLHLLLYLLHYPTTSTRYYSSKEECTLPKDLSRECNNMKDQKNDFPTMHKFEKGVWIRHNLHGSREIQQRDILSAPDDEA